MKGEAATVTPDSISVIEMRPVPHVVGSVAAPAAMIGPPDAIAVAADQSFAIVTAAQKAGADPMNPDPDDLVSVIGLADPAHPVVLQTAHAGPGASGVSINAAGTLVLVACKQDDAVHVFALAGKRLTHVARVALGDKSQPTDVIFAPDGRACLCRRLGRDQDHGAGDRWRPRHADRQRCRNGARALWRGDHARREMADQHQCRRRLWRAAASAR